MNVTNAPLRALIVAPTTRDGEVTLRMVRRVGLEGVICDSAPDLAEEFAIGADVLIASDELAKRPELLATLKIALSNQPGWSELPVIVVAKEDRSAVDVMHGIPGLVLLERPVQMRTFLSTVQAGLAARRRQYQIRDQLTENQRANEELRHTATFAQQLMAIVSHDLRNPLSAILNGMQLLIRNPDASVQRIAPIVKRSAERANGLINDLLDFSQARMGGGIPTKALPMNLNELLEDAVATMARSDPNRTILLTPCPTPLGSWDYDRLHQALVNLLVNAIKHSPADSTVELSSKGALSQITIEVINRNLVGAIPSAIRQTLFEPFKRFSLQGVNAKGSVGLGLFIVDQIVKGHGGQVKVESDAMLTTFTLRLPRETGHEPLASWLDD